MAYEVLTNRDLLAYICDFHTDKAETFINRGRIKGLRRRADFLIFTSSDVVAAIESGNLEALQIMHGRTPFPDDMIACAARKGHFEMIKWLHYNRKEKCTTWAMDGAAGNGHFDILKWLHENRTEGCTNIAMNYAATIDRLDIVIWLHENRTEGCDATALENAAEYGHLEVVKWLLEHKTFSQWDVSRAICEASRSEYGRETTKWLRQKLAA